MIDQQHDHRGEPRGLLEEREVGAVEVDAEVAGRERADEQRGQERADADRGGDARALKEVEDEVHGRSVSGA